MKELPKGAFTVIQDAAPAKPKESSLILSLEDVHTAPQKPNTGMIVYTAPELKEYQGKPVVFRENFAEVIDIEGVEHLYFRDFNSSIFYVVTE